MIELSGLLTQAEANLLIEMLKHTVEKEIAFPANKGGASFNVIGERKNDEFIMSGVKPLALAMGI